MQKRLLWKQKDLSTICHIVYFRLVHWPSTMQLNGGVTGMSGTAGAFNVHVKVDKNEKDIGFHMVCQCIC